jgi:hypothetical protein
VAYPHQQFKNDSCRRLLLNNLLELNVPLLSLSVYLYVLCDLQMRKQLRERMMMSMRVMMRMVAAMRSASRWSVSPDTGPLWLIA